MVVTIVIGITSFTSDGISLILITVIQLINKIAITSTGSSLKICLALSIRDGWGILNEKTFLGIVLKVLRLTIPPSIKNTETIEVDGHIQVAITFWTDVV